ncbi:MAG: aminotransferase class IV [Psychroflexus sp.]|jgi:branched-chain amino acid aminotransferase|nr:aminotransferase class IV [Psychroflexus sp.]MDR9448227.1 aminotransferase class IV [Psychroflexus sp.]
MAEHLILNGEFAQANDPILKATNRGFNYGDGVFETLRVINSEILFWEDHYFRMMSSMRIMRMEIPAAFSPEKLNEEVKTLIDKNQLSEKPVRVKFNIFRKPGGLYTPKGREVDYIITASAIPHAFYQFSDQPEYQVELFKDHYILSGLLSSIKSTNKAVNVLAGIYAEENSFDNCLLINESKSVVEAINGNIFLVKDNIVKTPPLSDGCLNGILRKQIIEIVKNNKELELDESSVSPFELQKSDEFFITNIIQGIIPITKYRKKDYEMNICRKLLGQLNAKARLG